MLLTFSIEQKKKILLCFVAAQPEDADVRKKPCTSGDDVCGRYATIAATKKSNHSRDAGSSRFSGTGSNYLAFVPCPSLRNERLTTAHTAQASVFVCVPDDLAC